jgi:hypothetical protein
MSVTNIKTPLDLFYAAKRLVRRHTSEEAADFLAGFETAIALEDGRPDVYAELKAIVTGPVGGIPFNGDLTNELREFGVTDAV